MFKTANLAPFRASHVSHTSFVALLCPPWNGSTSAAHKQCSLQAWPHPHARVYCAATPPRRAAALSALATTSIITAAAGGPALAGWSVLFAAVGFAAEAPVALMGVAAFICAGLADLIAVDFAGAALDGGLLPFVVFAVGGTAATVVEIVGSPEERAPLDAADKAREELEPTNEGTKFLRGALRAWDREFGRRGRKDE